MSVVAPQQTRSVDDVVAGPAQTTEDGAVGVVPSLGETQKVDLTVAAQLYDVVVLAHRSDRTLRHPRTADELT